MGKIFGNNKDLSSMYVAFAICIYLIGQENAESVKSLGGLGKIRYEQKQI